MAMLKAVDRVSARNAAPVPVDPVAKDATKTPPTVSDASGASTAVSAATTPTDCGVRSADRAQPDEPDVDPASDEYDPNSPAYEIP